MAHADRATRREVWLGNAHIVLMLYCQSLLFFITYVWIFVFFSLRRNQDSVCSFPCTNLFKLYFFT